MAKTYYVYALLRENSVPFYIGMGSGYRWTDHKKKAKYGTSHKDNIIKKMLRSIGDVPKVKLQENMTREEAIALEIKLIAILGREPNGPLTNRTKGGDGVLGTKPSEATRLKMRLAKLGKPRFFTKEHREKLSLAAKKRMLREPNQFKTVRLLSQGSSRPESREKNRLAHLGKFQSAETIMRRRLSLVGHTVSRKTRMLISTALKRRKCP